MTTTYPSPTKPDYVQEAISAHKGRTAMLIAIPIIPVILMVPPEIRIGFGPLSEAWNHLELIWVLLCLAGLICAIGGSIFCHLDWKKALDQIADENPEAVQEYAQEYAEVRVRVGRLTVTDAEGESVQTARYCVSRDLVKQTRAAAKLAKSKSTSK